MWREVIQITNTEGVSAVFSNKLLRTKELLNPLHSKGLYVNIDEVEPGGYSAKYHWHTLQDEFFLILEGHGIARIGDRSHPIRSGDFFFKPANSLAHQFFNNGEEILKILDCGIAHTEDAIVYPDDQVVWLQSLNLAFKLSHSVQNWSSTPDA